MAGVQFIYSSQFALGGPLFNSFLKLDTGTVNVILSTAGPLSGLLVQPIIGAISDKYESPYGRRRPFIVVGTIFTAAGMALIATSALIGDALGDKNDGQTASDHVIAICFAIGGLWIMNLFTNVIQGPGRALVNDVVDPSKLQLANAVISAVMAAAAVTANLVGAQFVNQKNPYFIIFLIGVGFVLFSMVPTVLCGKEKPYQRPDEDEPMSACGTFKSIFVAFRTMPFAMVKVVLVYFLSWVAYTPLMVNQSLFFGRFYHGNMSYGLYMAMYGLALFATIQATYSLVMPSLVKLLGSKTVYFGTQFISTVSFFCIWVLPFSGYPLQEWQIFFFTCLPALNFATFNSIPFALTTQIVGGKDVGLYMGALNSASVVAQTVTGFLLYPVLAHRDITYAIGLVGGSFSLLASLCVFWLDSESQGKPQELVLNNEEAQGFLTHSYS